MGKRGTETEFELTTIDRLLLLGYDYVHGEELGRPSHNEVVLKDRLRASIEARYPELPATAVEEVVDVFAQPDGVDPLRRNMAFHKLLTRGYELSVERDDGTTEDHHVYAVDWDNPDANEFLVANQVTIEAVNTRRPDLIVFVNGLPLVVFELKNPYSERPTVGEAINQIAHYRNDIPQLFEFNALAVVSDGVTTLHGMWTASEEWYAPWKSINGHDIEPGTTGSMKTLTAGLFRKDRLLAYIRSFILFEVAGDKITKKGAKYHQFFAVHEAVGRALDAFRNGGDKRLGVIWHTTGSGKSLSMVFLVGLLRRHPELRNPTFVIQVDRTDLDDQLHDQFNAAHALVGPVKHAESVDQLRDLLRTEGGEVVLTTIEKFRLKTEAGEVEHPILTDSANVIVIADEAHRSQYGFQTGYARYLTEALPNAKRLGFTGTPVSFSGADTIDVFGDVIHTYDIRQSQEDKATVPIFYEPRQVKLGLVRQDIDAALDEITEDQDVDQIERKKSRWTALAVAAGAKDRVEDLARDLLTHFLERTATLKGKAMAVCMTRENCVRLYDALTALEDCPEMKVIMTGNLGKDPEEWSQAGHITTKNQRDTTKQRLIDPDDPLQIVIVCDMWLTGTDIPCLHTLYIDKPMRGHNVIQAISRVNRVFSDKPHGLVVDYIGIGDDLREATNTYTQGGGKGNPAPSIADEALPVFLECLDAVRALVPEGIEYGDWRQLSRVELEDRYALVYGTLSDDDERRDDFLKAELRLSHAYLLVKHLDECRPHADELIFYQRVRKQIRKTIPGRQTEREVDQAVRDLVDDSVSSEGVVDIFESAGIENPDLSILDDEFLQTFKDKPLPNLRLKLLEKLLADKIKERQARNVTKARSFLELLQATLQKYHNRLIDAAAVIRAIIQIRDEMEADDQRAQELGLEEGELAFYDAIAANFGQVYGQEFLRDLIHDVVVSIKRSLKVDWTEPHRRNAKAAVRVAVKNVLRKRGVKAADLDGFVSAVMEQAEASFRDWPLAA